MPASTESPTTPAGPETLTAVDMTKLPAVPWKSDRHRLIWDLLRLLNENEEFRRCIWRRPEDPAAVETQITVCQKIAPTLLANERGFPDIDSTDALRKHYGLAVKMKLWNLQKQYDTKMALLDNVRYEDETKLTTGAALVAWGSFLPFWSAAGTGLMRV